MTIKLKHRSKIGIGIATFAAVAATLPLVGIVEAAPLGNNTPATGVAIISPSTVKTSGETFQLNLPPTARVEAGGIVSGSSAVTFTAGAFTAADVGRNISGTGIPASTAITAVNTGTNVVTISANATATNTSASLTISESARCPGDATNDHRWTTYIVPAGTDSSQLTFAPVSGTPSGAAAGFTSALQIPTGTIVQSQTSLNVGSGAILLPAGGVSLSLRSIPVPPGNYKIGIACSLNLFGTPPLGNETTRFWETTTTVVASPVVAGTNPQGFIWGNPAAPAQSVLAVASVTPTGGVVNFTKPLAIPAVSSYTANLTGGAGTATVNAAAGTITLSGLTTGTPYSLSLTSTNSIAPDATSGSVTVTPANATPPAPVATSINKAGKAVVNWTVPVSGPPPTGYTVDFASAVCTPACSLPAPIVVLANVTTTGDVTLPVGDYTATVKATYAPAELITAPLASNVVAFKSLPNALIEQEITVVRRQLNALILTQRCGVNSVLPAENATARFPAVLEIPAVTGDGNAPTKTDPVTGLQVPITNFSEYPIPVSPDYPTRCGITLTTPKLVTTGDLRGQYFTATGALNQVTVADFRDGDIGWTLTGAMGNFTDGGSNSFPGNYLGWNPALPIVSQVTAAGYAQTVTAGAIVQPGDGVGGTFGPGGLGGSGTLATGASGIDGTPLTGGTGIADLNARVKLLIPTTANAATYKGILTFTVA